MFEDIKAQLEADKQAKVDALIAELEASNNELLVAKLAEMRNELVAEQATISAKIEAIDAEVASLTPVAPEFHPEIEEVVEG